MSRCDKSVYMYRQNLQTKKYFYVSLRGNFLLFFCGGPLVVEALGNCPVCPPLNPALFHGIHAMNVCGLKQHDINSYTHLLLGHLYWVFEEQEANRLVARRRRQ